MIPLPNRSLRTSLGLFGALALLAWGAYTALLPPKKSLSPERRQGMETAVKRLLTSFPRPADRVVRLAVAPLTGDYTGEVTQHVRDALDGEGSFNVAPASLMSRLRGRLHVEPRAAENLESALAVGRRTRAEWVLWGRVTRLSQTGSEVVVDIALALNRADTKGPLWRQEVRWPNTSGGATGAGAAQVAAEIARPRTLLGRGVRLLACLAFTALLSLAALPLLRFVLERESNLSNFLLLASLTVVDGAASLLILRGSFFGFVYGTVVLLLLIVAGWYNKLISTLIEKNR